MLTVYSLLDGAVIRIKDARAVILMLALLLIPDKIVVMTNPENKYFEKLQNPQVEEMAVCIWDLSNNKSGLHELKHPGLEKSQSLFLLAELDEDLAPRVLSGKACFYGSGIVQVNLGIDFHFEKGDEEHGYFDAVQMLHGKLPAFHSTNSYHALSSQLARPFGLLSEAVRRFPVE